jgi:hypothetical protein
VLRQARVPDFSFLAKLAAVTLPAEFSAGTVDHIPVTLGADEVWIRGFSSGYFTVTVPVIMGWTEQ